MKAMPQLKLSIMTLLCVSILSFSHATMPNKRVFNPRQLDDGTPVDNIPTSSNSTDAKTDDAQKADDGLEFGCHNELLYSYGVLNSGKTLERSRLCANSDRSSCCSRISEDLVLNAWKNNNKVKIKQYIESYLWMFKAILNHYKKYAERAKTVSDFPGSPDTCKLAARYFLDNFIAKSDIEAYVDRLTKLYEHLAFTRKSFYCMLCSSETQQYFNVQDFTVVFAKKFCENLVSSMVAEIRERDQVYMPIFNAMSVLSECDVNAPYNPDTYSIDMQLNVADSSRVDKCHNIFVIKNEKDPRVFFTDCEDFCKSYSLSRATEIFEGNFGKLNFLYQKIRENKEVLDIDDIIFDEVDVTEEIDFAGLSVDFFGASLASFDFEVYASHFEKEGIELFYLASNSKTLFGPSELSGSIAKSVFIAILTLVVLIVG